MRKRVIRIPLVPGHFTDDPDTVRRLERFILAPKLDLEDSLFLPLGVNVDLKIAVFLLIVKTTISRVAGGKTFRNKQYPDSTSL